LFGASTRASSGRLSFVAAPSFDVSALPPCRLDYSHQLAFISSLLFSPKIGIFLKEPDFPISLFDYCYYIYLIYYKELRSLANRILSMNAMNRFAKV
jgi:hypothetical protein